MSSTGKPDSDWRDAPLYKITDKARLTAMVTKRSTGQSSYLFKPLSSGWKCIKKLPDHQLALDEIRDMVYKTKEGPQNYTAERHATLWIDDENFVHALIPHFTQTGDIEKDRMRAIPKPMLKRLYGWTKKVGSDAIAKENCVQVDDHYMPILPSMLLDEARDTAAAAATPTKQAPAVDNNSPATPKQSESKKTPDYCCTLADVAKYTEIFASRAKCFYKESLGDLVQDRLNGKKTPARTLLDFTSSTAIPQKLSEACVLKDLISVKTAEQSYDFASGVVRACVVNLAMIISPAGAKTHRIITDAGAGVDAHYKELLGEPEAATPAVVEKECAPPPQKKPAEQSSAKIVDAPLTIASSTPLATQTAPPPPPLGSMSSLFSGFLSSELDSAVADVDLASKELPLAVATGLLLRKTFDNQNLVTSLKESNGALIAGSGAYADGSALMKECAKFNVVDFLRKRVSVAPPTALVTKIGLQFVSTAVSVALGGGMRKTMQDGVDKLKTNLETVTEQLSAAKTELEAERTSRKRCSTEALETAKRARTLEDDYKKSEAERKTLQEECSAAQSRIAELEKQIADNLAAAQPSVLDAVDEEWGQN